MSYKVAINKDNRTFAIGKLSFNTSEDTLGMQVDFEILYREKELVSVGDVVRIYKDGNKFFTGKVIDVKKNGHNPRTVTCFDYGFYLNENEVVIQFKKIRADEAIRKLLERYGIKSNITNLPFKITKIYKGEKVSEIIKDILNQCSNQSGHKYFFEMQDMTLVIAKQSDYELKTKFNLIMNPSVTESMQNMKNRIVVTTSDEKKTTVFTTVEDNNSIKKFGLLQKVESIDVKEKSKATKIAQELLKELNRVEFNASFELLGSIDIRSNRIITIKEPITGIEGKFYIKSATHNVSSGTHVVSVEVRSIG